jgi:hypothetical protein
MRTTGGFSLDAGVRIKAADRQGLERLLRYWLDLPLRWNVCVKSTPEHLGYESVKPGPGGSVSVMLTPLELIDRLAALIPPPRRHRHRYYGVLAPHAPLRGQLRPVSEEQPSPKRSGFRLLRCPLLADS